MNKLIFLLALTALLTTKAYAQKPDIDEDGNPVEWYQGFESTTIPSGWVQTVLVKTSGGVDLYWRFQTGGGYISNPALKDPAAAYKGNYNALFFTHDDQASTMLETPWWNITSDKPAVAFWLTQVSRVGVDALTIQYSIKQPNGSYGTWQSLETFTTAQEGWARKIVALPDAVKGKNIKIGFVGELNMGLGICLDEFMIVDLTSKPRQINSLMLYHNSLVSPTGTSNNPVAMLETSVVGASNNLKVSQLNLTYTGTNINDINSLKLYVTRSNVFTTENPINATYSNTGNNLQIIVGDPTTSPSLLTGLNYIWVCANINTSATHGNNIKFTLPVNGLTTKLYNSISGLLEETKQYPLLLQSPSGESTIEQSIFVDEFESGTSKWVLGTNMQIGLPTGLGTGDPLKAFSGSNILATNLSGNYPPNITEGSTNYIATTQTINAKYYKNISVRFRRWLNIESKDKVGMWLSTDNGSTWKKIYENIFGVSDNYWTSQSFDISSEATRKEQVKFRLGISSSDGTDERGGLNIENFAITGDYIAKDVGVESFIPPTSSCNLGTDVKFTVSIRNYGAESVSGPFNVGLSVNEGDWVYNTFNGTIGVGASQNFTFTTGANLSEYGVKNIRFKTMLTGDEDASNDNKSTSIYSYPTITAPITESFEVLLNHWYPYGTNSSWQWGAPSGTIINKAGHSTSAWATKLNGNYNLSEQSYLESPCYTLPGGEQNMVFSFLHKAALEEGVDGFTVQYSTDGGNTWNVLPKHASYSSNWLPTTSVTALSMAGWSVNTSDYVVSKTLLPPAAISAGTVKFRFVFASNSTNVNEGVAVDYVRLYALTNDIGISALVDPTTDCEIGLSPLTFKLKNYSTIKEYPAGDVPVTFSVNGSTPVTETYTLASPLAANTEVTLSATTKTYDFDKGTSFDIVAYTSLTDDDNKTNDKLETTVNVTGMPNYQVVGAELGVIGLPSITTYNLDAGIGYDSYLWKRWNGSTWVDIGSSRIATIDSHGRYQITVQKGSCYKTVEVQVVLSNVDVQVESYSGISDACIHSSSEKPSVSIKNNGSSLLPEGTIIPVAIFINDLKTLEENVTTPTGGLAAGVSLPYTFISGIDLSEAQAYQIKIGTRYVGDLNYTNDFTTEQTINTWGTPKVNIKAYHKNSIGINPVDIEQGAVLKSLQPDTISLDAGTGYAAYKWERKLFGASTWTEIGTSQTLTIDQNNSADYRLTATTMYSCGDAITEFAINAKDLGISSIEGLAEDYCQTEEGITFNVIIQNYGLDSYLEGTNINLIFNTPVGIQNKTVVLDAGSAIPSGGSLTVALPSPIKLGVGLNPIRISTDMDDDCEPSNDSYDVSVMVKAAPTVTINPNVIKAVFNSSSELAINPIYSNDCNQFNWSHGPTTRNIIIYGIPAPEYTVTATNEDGCSASAKVNIISTDISVSSLVSPISKCELVENSPQAQITILNSGSIPFETGTTIRLKLYIDNVLVPNGEEDLVLDNQLAAGQTIPFTFSNVNMQTALTGKSSADIKVEATLIDIEDINPANNTLINTIHSTGYPSISLGTDRDVHAWTQVLSATPDPGYASYDWSFAPSGTSTFESVGTNPTYTASQQIGGKGSGIYKLLVIDAYGCSGTASTNITFFVDDLEITEIINPTSGCNRTNNETISITLKNNSSWDLPVGTNYQLGVKIGSGAEVIEGYTLGATLAKDATIEKDLTTKANLYTIIVPTSTDITVRAIFPTDMVADNNSKTKTVESYPPVGVEIEGGLDEIEYTTTSYTLDMSGYESVEWTLSDELVLVDGTLTSDIIKVSGTGNACVKAYNTWGCFAEDCAHLTYKNPDLTVTDIITPTGGCDQTTQETISVTIKNVGVVAFNANEYIPLQLKSVDPDALETFIDGGFLLPADLDPNTSYTHTFENKINLTKVGIHQLTVSVSHASDENTSNNSKVKTIESHPIVIVNLGSDRNTCEGSTTILDAGNAGAQSYAWSKDGSTLAETGQTLSVSTPGLYSVIVTNNKGCTGTSSTTVNVNPVPTVNLGNDVTLCSDQSLTLDAGNSGATYLWSTGATNSTISVTSSGTYSVSVINSYNCSSSDEIIITFSTPPTVTHSALNPVCLNSAPITLTGGSPGGGVYTGPGASNVTFTPSAAGAGTHTLTYTYTDAYGCSNSVNVDIKVNPTPVVNLGENRSVTAPIVLDAGAGFVSYKWQDNSTQQTFTVQATGLYSVTVTDNNGCTGYDEVYITFMETLDVYVSSLVSPISRCFNNTAQPVTVELTNRGSKTFTPGEKIEVSYQIGTNQPKKEEITFTSSFAQNSKVQHTFSGTELQNSGNYTVTCYTTIAGENGQSSNFNVSIYTKPNLNLGPDTLRTSLPYVLQSGIGNVTYLWNTGATGASITVSQHGKYWLRVTDANSCAASDTIVIWWPVSAEIISGINAKIKLFPNPVKDELNVWIESDKAETYTLELINPQGLLVHRQQTIPSDKITDVIQVEKLTPGMYILRVSTDKGSGVFKVIVDKY